VIDCLLATLFSRALRSCMVVADAAALLKQLTAAADALRWTLSSAAVCPCGAALLLILAVTSWAQDFGGRGAANPLPCQCSDVDPRESFISTVPFTCWYGSDPTGCQQWWLASLLTPLRSIW
jgi:hypothetical protein